MKPKEEVVVFLEGLKTYLYGDLKLFEKLCSDAEKKENERLEENRKKKSETEIGGLQDSRTVPQYYTASNSANSSPLPSTTSQTTKNPTFDYSIFEDPNIYRSTIPHILTVLATNDLVGFLLGDWGTTPTPTTKNMKKFFSHVNDPSEADVTFLTFFYRHGMAHSYFPKKKLGIKAHSTNPPKKLFFLEEGIIVLNADYLIELTKERLEGVLKDTSLIPNMKIQFEKLEAHDTSKMSSMGIDLETFKNGLTAI